MDAKTLNTFYEKFIASKDVDDEIALYTALCEYARKIGRVHFESHYGKDEFRDACHDAATDVFVELNKFRGVNSKGKPCAFASFAQNCLVHDLMDWIKVDARKDVVTLDDPAHPVVIHDTALPLDTKMHYKQLLNRLSPEERELFALTAEGYSQKEIADSKGVNQGTVSRHWDALQAKLRGWHDEKVPPCKAKAKRI